jgi:hypothetical protein
MINTSFLHPLTTFLSWRLSEAFDQNSGGIPRSEIDGILHILKSDANYDL